MRIDDNFLKIQTAVEKITNSGQNRSRVNTKPEKSFDRVLGEAEKIVGFSKHAVNRMNERDIELNGEDMKKLSFAVESADNKGIRDSLILMEGKAFIVNVPSNIVVTVLDSTDIEKQKVFTNLDGAVII